MRQEVWASVLVLLTAPAVGGNLLVNPSFESGTTGWSRYPASWPACVTTLGVGEGWAGMRLACGVPPVEAGLKQVIAVRGGQAYRVGFRFQASGLSAKGDVILSFRGPQGVVWQTGVEEFAGSWPWSEVSWVVQAPASATALELRVGVSAGIEGEAGFDDLVFEEVETVLAGRNEVGDTVRVLIANQVSASAAYRLHLAGVPARFTYTVDEIADRHPCVPGNCSEALVQGGDERDLVNGALKVALPSPAVHLVSITAAGDTPRPPRRHLAAGR